MKWYVFLLGSSVGKKLLMAVTGTFLAAFLCVHLLGNLMAFAGAGAFNGYAHKLHSLEPYITVFNICLLVIALIHVSVGIILFIQNLSARPDKYQVSKNPGGRTFASDTMPYTGALILLFTIIHLSTFTFVDKSALPIYQLMTIKFASLSWVLFYVIAMTVVAVHISHGFWSLFQTFGLNHPDHMRVIEKFGLIFSVFIGVGFGSLPIYLLFFA
ncbi:MAG: succinate dehydrogenase cytochrome b subunit [Desulfobulbaceae bacterium]|nr:succinate dehydrogenase cytochrome b subunit [Desulfobulbaceae bacterium]